MLLEYDALDCSENNQGVAPVDSEWLGQQGLLSEDYIHSNRKVNGQRPLFRAIEKGDIQTFKVLLKHKAEVNIKPADGCTPLYQACQKGNTQMVYILSRYGARAVFSDDEDSPALSIAIQQGYSLIVELLLNNSLRRWLNDSEAELLIKQASRDAIIKMIENNSFDPSNPADPYQLPREQLLNSAIDDGNSANVTDLVTRRVLIHTINKRNGNTRVHEAANSGQADVINEFIKHGINPSVLNRDGLAAIHLAAQNDKANVIETMAQLNCDINIPTRDDQLTPLHMAAEQGHVESIKQLHVEGAYLDAVSIYGETPLHLAIQSGHLPVIKELIERGAALDAVTHYGDNPIHLAIKYVQSSSVLDKLTQSVDDLSRVDCDGLTPVHLAAKYGQLETLRFFKLLLINHVDRDNSQLWRLYDSQGNSPLHLAALHHHTLAAKWLLQNDLQLIDNTNNQGQKPLDLAQDAAMIKLLEASQSSQQGQTPLDHVAKGKGCNHRVADLLTKRRADPNTYAEDINKGTLRHERAQEYVKGEHERKYCREVLLPLINRGSAALNKDAYNQTLLHFAVCLKELKATKKHVDRLCEFGSLNSQDYRGQTPLHKMACQLPANLDNADQWLYRMLNRRPDVNIKDVYGKTWLDYVGIHCKLDKLQAFVTHAFQKELDLQPSTLKQAFKEHCWHHEIKPELFRLQGTDPRSDDAQQCFKAYHPQYESKLDNIWIWEQLLTNHSLSMADRLSNAVEKVRDYIKSTGVDLIFESSQKLAVASTTKGVRLSSSSYSVTGVHPREEEETEQSSIKSRRFCV